jgi:hypothetical protein
MRVFRDLNPVGLKIVHDPGFLLHVRRVRTSSLWMGDLLGRARRSTLNSQQAKANALTEGERQADLSDLARAPTSSMSCISCYSKRFLRANPSLPNKSSVEDFGILQACVPSREASGRPLRGVDVWRRGMPISQAFTFAANLNEQSVSCRDFESGATFTNMRVFESPPKQG